MRVCIVLTLVGICCWGSAVAGNGEPGYGAEDLVPSPEKPIGFQADGNGWYPGAAPAVVEWWDGRPGWGKVVDKQIADMKAREREVQ